MNLKCRREARPTSENSTHKDYVKYRAKIVTTVIAQVLYNVTLK